MTNMNEKKLNLKQNIDFIRILIYAAIVGLVAGTIGTLFTVCVITEETKMSGPTRTGKWGSE